MYHLERLLSVYTNSNANPSNTSTVSNNCTTNPSDNSTYFKTLLICWAKVIKFNCIYQLYFNQTSGVTAATSTDRPKSARNRCVIEVFGGVVVTLLFGFVLWV